jgi:hypothetical protein
LLLAFPVTFLVGGIADKGHLPGPLVFLLSPGYVLGSLATAHVNSFSKALNEFMLIELSVDLFFWSSVLFGLFSLRSRNNKST